MPWVRLDDRFPSHRKVALLSDKAFRLHVSALCWCSENLTEGKILDTELRVIAHVRGMKAAAKELESRQLWDRVDDGWVIHDFLVYNPDRVKVQNGRERNATRQQAYRDRRKAEKEAKAAAEAAAKPPVRNGVTPPVTYAVSNSAPKPVPPLPTEEGKLAGRAGETDTVAPKLRSLANALHHAGLVGLGWDLKGDEAIRIEALITAKGIPAMVQRARSAAGRATQPVGHVRYFLGLAGSGGPWMDLPTITEGPDAPTLRAVSAPGTSRSAGQRAGLNRLRDKLQQQGDTA
ncbi:hypothetical protein ACFRCG_41670 [Embleya sp. NPDC056575]|uniref:hypothetical protein n=1 Tax=unclassified Embleya TaxID=2699296 RepID=UPI00368CC462